MNRRQRVSTFLVLLFCAPSWVLAQDMIEDDLQAILDESPTESAQHTEVMPVDETMLDDLPNLDLDSLDVPEGTALEPLPTTEKKKQANSKKLSDDDELEAFKADLDGEKELLPLDVPEKADPMPEKKTVKETRPVPKDKVEVKTDVDLFDVGGEEKLLLSLAQKIEGQISDNEWSEVATAAKTDSYTVVKDDWLFKISRRLFGSGFYYPKIWSINSFITNPHFIEPGIVLSFTTGSGSTAPAVKLGEFTKDELQAVPGSIGNTNPSDYSNFGEEVKPPWIDEKRSLSDQGVYIQFSSEETMDDILKASEQALNREYESYDPPKSEFDIVLPKNYDKDGFDRSSKIQYTFKEGFYLSTFVSTNIVQDFGSLVNGPDENIIFSTLDHAFVKFDDSINVMAGDRFSVYTSHGKVEHDNSDRAGYKYSVVGHIKTIRKIRDKWEVQFIEISGTPQRGDRLTAYTPKIERVTRTYNSRLVEAGILATYLPMQTIIGFGDVVYLDRGRADGVDLGNVFDVYGFKDRLTTKNISDQPTYKTGELTVITLTDNFATAIVSSSIRDFATGDIAITKTKEAHLREQRARKAKVINDKESMGGKALEELDVELNLENLNEDLLKEADKIQLTEDELAELERQEREKSVIKDSERDLKALERLENEIEQAEKILNDAKLDEDKVLENQSLDEIEKRRNSPDQDSLDEIEENLGKRYMDEDLNSKDNPFGLTEFDVEEIDELLNVEKKGSNTEL